MKIYTKTGDKGETSLFGGKRVSKADLRVEAYGTIDELNSLIGVILSKVQSSKFKSPHYALRASRGKQNYNSKVKTELNLIQNDLFEIGSQLARGNACHPEFISGSRIENAKMLKQVQHDNKGVQDANKKIKNNDKLLEKRVICFEKLIDELEKELPKLSNFILPGGGEVGSLLSFARTVARRAERRVVALKFKVQSFHLRQGFGGQAKFKVQESNIIIYLNRLSDLLFVMARFVNSKEKKKEIVWNKNKIDPETSSG